MKVLDAAAAEPASGPRPRSVEGGWIEVQLDVVHECLVAGIGTRAVRHLLDALDHAWENDRQGSSGALIEFCRSHPLHDLLMKDPYTARARAKPRGYAGDPVTLDYVYSPHLPEGICAIGADVFRATTGSSAARSLVARRDLLTRFIDRTARTRRRTRVLAIGCGYLREAARSKTLTLQGIQELWALDHDPESLALVSREHSGAPVHTMHATVEAIVRGEIDAAEFDLIYAAGVLDYLDDATASKLLEVLFKSLRPGGSLLVGNFTPTHQGRGYMAVFMDWRLRCRTQVELAALWRCPGAREQPDMLTWTERAGNIAYLVLSRR